MRAKNLDRRVGKTKQALHQALLSLMRQKRYDAILVQDILTRANVGRSTFYAHYRDKDELLVDGLRHLKHELEQEHMAQRENNAELFERVIAFSGPMFAHTAAHRDVYESLLGGPGSVIIRVQLESTIQEIARNEIASARTNKVTPDLLAQHVATSFFSVLNWWLAQPQTISPAQVNAQYRELVIPVLRSQLI